MEYQIYIPVEVIEYIASRCGKGVILYKVFHKYRVWVFQLRPDVENNSITDGEWATFMWWKHAYQF